MVLFHLDINIICAPAEIELEKITNDVIYALYSWNEILEKKKTIRRVSDWDENKKKIWINFISSFICIEQAPAAHAITFLWVARVIVPFWRVSFADFFFIIIQLFNGWSNKNGINYVWILFTFFFFFTSFLRIFIWCWPISWMKKFSFVIFNIEI